MGITRRVLLISSALSIAITAALLVLLSGIGGAHARAEASELPAARADRGSRPSAEPRPAPAAPEEARYKRIRAIVRNLVTPTGRINPRAVTALQAVGADVIPFLLPRFSGEDGPAGEAMLQVLEAFNEPEVAHHLIDVLSATQSNRMGRRIGAAVHTLGDPQCCDRLIDLTGHEREAVRLGAAVALRTCPSGDGAAALARQILHDPSAECRLEALESLAAAPDVFVEDALRIAVRDEAADVRLAAAKMLGRRQLAGFEEDLRRLSRSDPSPQVRKACAQALLALRRKAAANEENSPEPESSPVPPADN